QTTKEDKLNHSFGLCLGGGGGKGAYQLGVYKALIEYGLFDKITAMSGASIGALNALLFTMNDYELAEKCWSEINMHTVFSPDIDLLFNDKTGFMSRNEMLKLVDKYIDFGRFYTGKIDVYVNATYKDGEINKSRYMHINDYEREQIKTIITASSAMPLLYESVSFEGMELTDGGLSDNIPVAPLYDQNNLNNIIVCGLNKDSRKDLSRYTDVSFIEIYPSVNLGDTLDGTLNFTKDAVKFRKMLGYKDTMRALKVYFEEDPAYIDNLALYEANDLSEIAAALKIEQTGNKAAETRSKLDNIINKYQ
ncbi:MAG: patatin-like phospholipase family protein, partial [Coprococcus sp.]